MFLDDIKLLNSVKWESATKDTVTLTVDGDLLRQEVYESLKLEIDEGFTDTVRINFQDYPFIELIPNELFDENYCKQLATEIVNRVNEQMKSQLDIK